MIELTDQQIGIAVTVTLLFLTLNVAAPYVLVIDESHHHAGHAGAREGGGHFRAVVVSERFEGKLKEFHGNLRRAAGELVEVGIAPADDALLP